ncbi:acyl-CoA dehydrogenase family protein [Nonomuraea sp. CA-218870]|uniref:acyl-CoA dehydrogenase family protein n=1 Tax=Nonomuraea sp. CA-218870 TaxID=3239998 RepID=UPI003D91B55C
MDFDFDAAQRRRHDDVLASAPRWEGARPGGREAWRLPAELGLTGLCLPREYGGGALGALDTAHCLEAFGRACPDTGLAFGVAAHLLACGVPIRDFAGGEVRASLLTGMAQGRLIAGNAMTEEGAGSDIAAIAARATRDGDAYVLEGRKSFVSNGPIADVFVTYAVTDPRAGFLGLSAFAVPRGLPGVRVGEPYEKLGLDGCQASWVEFDGCRVPADHRLGGEGQGGLVFQRSMAWERGCLFGVYLGLMERQLREAGRRAAGRRQFGRRLADFQAVSHRLAVMRQRLESARLLLYRACWLIDRGRAESTAAVALSKVAVSEAVVANSLDAVHLSGAAGYLSGEAERHLRDAVPSTIFSGTTEIQREIIAREAGL